MYHFFVEEENQIREGSIVITGEDVNHIRNVLRMKEGEKIRISDGRNKDYLCQIDEIGRDQVTARILEAEEESRELGAKIYLFQGLPKGDKMELIIQKAVELGAWEIIPVTTRRTVVKLDQKKAEAKRKRWNAISESAAKQSGRTVIPQVGEIVTFKEAIARGKSLDKSLIPYECADDMAETRAIVGQLKKGMDIGIFIGPEGGFDKEEIQEAMDAGIRPITLGKRILRTETAGLAALSILMFALEEG
ncbi:MAG TPA: 16S rRNA (uracil(1498)-N(3))-methyltransferase [Candidatus Lachnoclostridium stercoravium]|uniref:Ribosomal RNA small subunit methyltransferase E n=1 Tax=Candidatus Lachnoclostridium stercoravium TaxID=2838633 RepID=A0A9D2HHA8_9FIRM|nr:16S rRNA (uracil(1498)-N(3))-methyltransferase [Candidatus Lachnoclostridium stercoravium]